MYQRELVHCSPAHITFNTHTHTHAKCGGRAGERLNEEGEPRFGMLEENEENRERRVRFGCQREQERERAGEAVSLSEQTGPLSVNSEVLGCSASRNKLPEWNDRMSYFGKQHVSMFKCQPAEPRLCVSSKLDGTRLHLWRSQYRENTSGKLNSNVSFQKSWSDDWRVIRRRSFTEEPFPPVSLPGATREPATGWCPAPSAGWNANT